MLDPEVERKNLRFGLAIFALELLLFFGSIIVAILYVASTG